MNPGPTAERVLEALRTQIMDHVFRPGDRLDPAWLAGQLAASVTPVRDALNRLTGEGLVEARHASGFHLPGLDEPLLHDLYDWSNELVGLAIAAWPRRAATAEIEPRALPGPAHDADAVFGAIAARSRNSQHARAMTRLNARLHAVRRVEPRVLAPIDDEFAPWLAAMARDDRQGLRRLARHYHRRRQRAAAGIVRAAYRAP